MHLVGHGDGAPEEERQPGLAPELQHLLVVGRQHRLAHHLVESAVGQQEVLEVGELWRDAELLNIGQNLGIFS
jgi:hypothetical protein